MDKYSAITVAVAAVTFVTCVGLVSSCEMERIKANQSVNIKTYNTLTGFAEIDRDRAKAKRKAKLEGS